MAEERDFIPKSDILEVTTRFIKTKDFFHHDKEDYEQVSDGFRLKSSNDPKFEPNSNRNNTIFNWGTAQELGSKRDDFGTTSGQRWGFYSEQFDEVMRESSGRRDKREVAETIGLPVTSDTFRKLLARRIEEGKVRPYRGSHYLIEWINRDYEITRPDKLKNVRMLDIKLPLKLHELVAIPPRSVIGIAGYTSSGKTAALLEIAELNVFTQPMPVYYWYNEMSEAKMIKRWEDYPQLEKALNEKKFYPVMQTNFEFPDVLNPDSINIIDYLDRDDDMFLIGEDIKKLYANLSQGIVAFGLQKKAKQDLGYGGIPSIKLANLYIALDIKTQDEKATHGIARIIKAKDWKQDDYNPNSLWCEYYTGGKHGKLFLNGEWKRKKEI